MQKIRYLFFLLILTTLVGCAPAASVEQPVATLNTVSDVGIETEYVLYFGGVRVDKEMREIRFDAVVNITRGWVQHLVYLHGYQWLREESAIVSDARLPELQHAIAVLDWELWDNFWQGIDNEETKKIKLYISQGETKIEANHFINIDETIYLGHIVFLGCPYFDGVALGTAALVDCELCPVFPLEREALQSRFTRENGLSGFELNEDMMFGQDTEVEVIIQFP